MNENQTNNVIRTMAQVQVLRDILIKNGFTTSREFTELVNSQIESYSTISHEQKQKIKYKLTSD